ncbi:DUF4190 domain-containing protein [Nocardioides bruguierae]|uniref:DUF4190 domain-containing protein n=1 Tax=Nocardioides bruguierae TaxID=2945102 RepID=A0A9X2D7R7_9ACTN|nr:DUF4190 domain-containing protein [Nocardioides bruguierae]MCM0620817.1 DUF4190 domain-containing protein [Nocardioides bruguierae]
MSQDPEETQPVQRVDLTKPEQPEPTPDPTPDPTQDPTSEPGPSSAAEDEPDWEPRTWQPPAWTPPGSTPDQATAPGWGVAPQAYPPPEQQAPPAQPTLPLPPHAGGAGAATPVPAPQAPQGYPPASGAHGQPAYGQPYQQPYQQQYQPQAYPQPGYPYAAVPRHGQAMPALVLGIVGLALGLMCGLGFLASPVAWVLGARARRAVRREPDRWGGTGEATAGMVLGIIGTVFLALGLLAIAFFVVLAIAAPTSSGPYTGV